MDTTRRRGAVARRYRSRSRGQSLVEFALVLPIFLLLISGMLDLGLALYTNMTVANATREGARVGVVSPSTSVVEDRVRAMSSELDQTRLGVSTTCREPSGSTWVSCSAPLWQSGDTVVVTTTYTYRMLWPLAMGATLPLASTVEMRIE
jgi:Flp pilus assembly protein TadG